MTAPVHGPAATALREHLRRAGGSVPFEEFMRWALYDPAHGYYARRVRTVGREGDFSTSATLGPALAGAVAAWASSHRDEVRTDGARWHVVELGGGGGQMAGRFMESLGWWARRGLRYHLVEISTGLRETQRRRLARWSRRASWHGSLSEALAAAGGNALIFSNEFVDAFPCARWVFEPGAGWREMRVAWPDDAPEPLEVSGEMVSGETLAVSSVADAAPAGQRVEVFLSYRRWLRDQLAGWQRGRLLTIDYGDLAPALYHRRPSGTLRAYCRQQRFTGREVYARVGQQDLTADVNFSDLQRWGDELGLATAGFFTQADFLQRRRPHANVDDPRLAFLSDPDGAGGAFKVLEQARGVPPSARQERLSPAPPQNDA